MIVTRQAKKKRGSALPILLPIAALAMLGVALTWPPSRHIILNGPLKPVSNVVMSFWGTVSRPLTFAYQQQQITDRNIELKRLADQMEAQRKVSGDKDQQVQTLQRQINALNAEPAAVVSTPAPIVRPSAAAGAPGLGTEVSPEKAAFQRTGQQWAAMDPEKAAALVGSLPDDYVAGVFALMAPDAVGAILENLPAKTAARIVQTGGTQLSAQGRR